MAQGSPRTEVTVQGEAPTHYELLGVSRSVTPDEVRALRRSLARRYHPDVAVDPDPGRLGELLTACEVLGHPDLKASYDAGLARAAQNLARASRPRVPDASPGVDPGGALRFPHGRSGPDAGRAARRHPFDWEPAILHALFYAAGAMTVPGYVSAYVIGGWFTSAGALGAPHPLLFNGPIAVVLAVQGALAAGVSILADRRAWRRRRLR